MKQCLCLAMLEKKIRISPMKSRISWTKLGKEEELSMKLTKFASALRMRSSSCKQHWRKKSWKVLERHTKERLNQCKAHWKLRPKQRVRQSDIRKKLEADLNELDIALEH